MRTIPFFGFITLFFVSSCHMASYRLLSSIEYVDFSEGKWLINDIQGHKLGGTICHKMHVLAMDKFKKVLGSRLYDIRHSGNIILPAKIPLDPSSNVLSDIKSGSVFDYFINIKAELISDTFGTIQITKPNDNKNLKNEVHLVVEIYDLNTKEVISQQRAVGIIGNRHGTRLAEGFSFSTQTIKLATGALNKILKKLIK